ncbi:MAG TPA: hypothetical protein VGG61_10625 [Gemmataceae bacterium]
MGPNRRAQERERAAAEAAAKAKRAEAERTAVAEAQKIVAIWNARQAGGRALWFYPTIGAAIAAGCRGCRSPARRADNVAPSICGRLTGTPAARSSSLVPVLPEVLAQCPVRKVGNADYAAARERSPWLQADGSSLALIL